MLDQMQVTTTPPIDVAEYERAIANFAEIGIEAWIEDNTIAIGPHATLPFPKFHLVTTDAYADGYACGQQQCRQMIKADVSVSLTDHDLTKRIDQVIPATLSPVAHAQWRRGFVFGWVMKWYEEWSDGE